uniref:Coiled-coil domain-containing protein n=1 Tax=Anabas testudineus TaxID=64144 RepID=A0A3Q1IYL2_ANATE
MSAGRMPKCPASASQGFSSTPLKITQEKDLHTSRDLDDGVLSDDEDTFSLLSPIYHDSFDSAEEDLPHSPVQQTSPRCELRKTPSHQVSSADVHPASPTLSAWEMWLVNKAKEDRLKLEKKAEEERLLKQKREQQEREQMQKKIIVDEKIQEWLKMKNEQHKQFVKQSKEEELIQKQREKQREIEQKAQQKYNDWLQKKNREKIEKEKKIKEQEKERHKRAEEKFKDWLTKANEKSRASPKSPCYPTSPYDKSYPSPSFYNPIPWKPIQIPPPETSVNKTSGKKPRKQRTSQQNPNTAFRLRNTVSAGHLLQRR